MPSMKILRVAALAVVLGALYAAYVARTHEKVATLAVTSAGVTIDVEKLGVAPSPVIEQGELGATTAVGLVTGDGQQADAQSNAGVCSQQPFPCGP
jgi:hypothetical protein